MRQVADIIPESRVWLLGRWRELRPWLHEVEAPTPAFQGLHRRDDVNN